MIRVMPRSTRRERGRKRADGAADAADADAGADARARVDFVSKTKPIAPLPRKTTTQTKNTGLL